MATVTMKKATAEPAATTYQNLQKIPGPVAVYEMINEMSYGN